MIMSLVLFENEFLNIVAISFTALVLNELIMVALEITTWSVCCAFFLKHLLIGSMYQGMCIWWLQRSSHSSFTLLALHSCRNTLVSSIVLCQLTILLTDHAQTWPSLFLLDLRGRLPLSSLSVLFLSTSLNLFVVVSILPRSPNFPDPMYIPISSP